MMTGSNPIHALLDSVGLPFRSSRAQLMADHGARCNDWPDEVFIKAERPLLDGLLRPLAFRPAAQFDPALPPGYLYGYVHTGPDAMANLESVRRQLQASLSEPVAVGFSNARSYRWSFGTASVTASCFPPELQHRGRNPLHERHRRLAVACLIEVASGLRTALSTAERAWLQTYRPAIALPPPPGRAWDLAHSPPEDYEAEFVREPEGDPGRYSNTIGMSADREGLIYCAHQLVVVPAPAVHRFEVQRIWPGRGPGSSSLYLAVATNLPQWPEKQLHVASHSNPDGLSELAIRLQRLTGIDLVMLPDVQDS